MSYSFPKEEWNSDWAPVRDVLAMLFSLAVMSSPGLFWFYTLIERLQNTNSENWFAPTVNGQTSVFASYSGAILLGLLWFGIVFAMFGRPALRTLGELRS
ncbi:hypothetical protein [Halorussus halophilus]|uniref:hypothetical protein n=1 Tax=Halorussus halophilus TaxID=2650975 RepID=UPI00130181E5|nr:hypothetical protein [Halorussus halophilus]